MDNCGHRKSERLRFCLTRTDVTVSCPHLETERGGECHLFKPCVCECLDWAEWTTWAGGAHSRTCSAPVEDTCPTWKSLVQTENRSEKRIREKEERRRAKEEAKRKKEEAKRKKEEENKLKKKGKKSKK